MNPRSVFGAMAFLVAGAIVGFAMSPLVSEVKEQIVLIVLGNVLSWPVIVLQFYFGSSDGSKSKDAALAAAAAEDDGVLALTGSELP